MKTVGFLRILDVLEQGNLKSQANTGGLHLYTC